MTLLCNFKVSTTKEAQREVRKEMSQATRQSNCSSPISSQYTRADADKGLVVTKAKKAAGVDGIFPEFLKNLGLEAHNWLASLFTYCHLTRVVPSRWKESKIIVIPKPGKPLDNATSFCPISLLCTTYKHFERLFLAGLSPKVEPVLPNKKAGFRPGRSCADQVLALTTFIEAGY